MGPIMLEGRFQGTPEDLAVVQLQIPADSLAISMEWCVRTLLWGGGRGEVLVRVGGMV